MSNLDYGGPGIPRATGATYSIDFRRIPEHPGVGRLGRQIVHDSRSLSFQVQPRAMTAAKSVLHVRRAPVFDQGNLGSCVGNATLGAVGTEPLSLVAKVDYTEDSAVRLYSSATNLDESPGAYPPQDTGSSGLAGAKAAKLAGLISGYLHATSLSATITALQDGPVITGVSWYDTFDHPDSAGRVTIGVNAFVRGGHEFEIVGVDVDAQEFEAVNSWGEKWGDHGRFRFSFATFDRLLAEQGDVTVLLPLTTPMPPPVPPPSVSADQALADATRAWTAARHVSGNADAAHAVTAWRTAKGL